MYLKRMDLISCEFRDTAVKLKDQRGDYSTRGCASFFRDLQNADPFLANWFTWQLRQRYRDVGG